MEINKHITFSEDENAELLAYLRSNNIPYEEGEILYVLDIYESDPHWKNIEELMKRRSMTALSSPVFTKEELAEAEWLTVRSIWRNGYPIQKFDELFVRGCFECAKNLGQATDFRMKKTPNWGRRHFMTLNWVDEELFCDDIAKKELVEGGITGFSFRPVRNKNATETLENITQLFVSGFLPQGLVTDRRSIDDKYTCPSCGKIWYHMSGLGKLALRREVFDNAPDMAKTTDLFGNERTAVKKLIVSNRFYKIVTEKKLDRSLVFEPIELV